MTKPWDEPVPYGVEGRAEITRTTRRPALLQYAI